jgi:hypothetical protein
MIKRTITYPDYNGGNVTEDFYFNLTKRELIKWEVSKKGSLSKRLEQIVKDDDRAGLVEVVEDLLTMSYGVKSDDGKRFIKSQELVDEFIHTEAYDVLFMELVSDPDKASEFIKGIIPAEMAKQVENMPVEALNTALESANN